MAKFRKAVFDKYSLYQDSVQSPEGDVEFFLNVFKELRGCAPGLLKEDFCGTFALCCEWVKLSPKHRAIGIDLDPEPLQWGQTHNLNQLTSGQKKRINVHIEDVRKALPEKADIVIATNFSYFIFKTRERLRRYFKAVLKNLNPQKGIFILDIFGGSACHSENEEKAIYKQFTYYWHQRSYDPISHEAKFSIHFRPRGQKKQLDVFTYDWRIWGICEIRELLREVGFKQSHVYWEGTNRKGGGNGVFSRTDKGEECLAWIAYIVAEA